MAAIATRSFQKFLTALVLVSFVGALSPVAAQFSGGIFTTKDDGLGVNINLGELVVTPEHYFVMGDNRDESDDSRF